MGDPLSVAASIVGIIAVAGKCIKMANEFCSAAKDAPKTITELCEEMQQMQAIVLTLQELLTRQGKRKKLRRSRLEMISLYNIETTLSGCVLTCDRLNKHLSTALGIQDPRNPEERTGTFLDRLKWAWSKEKEAAEILAQLQRHKSSLTLILTIVQCKNDEEAAASHDLLQDLVLQAIQSDNEIALLLRDLIKRHFDQEIDLEDNESIKSATISSAEMSTSNAITARQTGTSIIATSITPQTPSSSGGNDVASIRSTSSMRSLMSLTSKLKHSRAYKRAHLWHSKYNNESDSHSVFSAESISPSAREGRWSMLSDLTLGDLNVSQVTILGLPIHQDDMWDPTIFNFSNSSTPRLSRKLSLISTSRGRIHSAISSNNELFVRTLINLGTDINEIDSESGFTPLIHSALIGREFICRILVDKGASSGADYKTMSGYSLQIRRLGLPEPQGLALLSLIRQAAESNLSTAFQVLVQLCFVFIVEEHTQHNQQRRSAIHVDEHVVPTIFNDPVLHDAALELFQDTSILNTASKIRWDVQSIYRLELKGYLHSVVESFADDPEAIHLLELLLRMGANIEERNPQGATILARAFFWYAEEACDLLLARGASIEAVARWYMTRDSPTAEDVQWFEGLCEKLEGEAFSQFKSTSLITVFRGSNLWSRFQLRSRLHKQILEHNNASVQTLLKLGVDIAGMHGGLTPLASAAIAGSETVFKTLIEHGASPEAAEECIVVQAIAAVDIPSLTGWFNPNVVRSPISAVFKVQDYVSGMRFLRTMNIQPRFGVGRLLHKAISLNKALILELLLDLGADIEHCNIDGYTPLAHAAIAGADRLCKLLLQRGASLSSIRRPRYNALLGDREFKGLNGIFNSLFHHWYSSDITYESLLANLKVLLEMGVDTESLVMIPWSNLSKTFPLFLAACWGPSHHLLPVLIQYGTNLRVRDHKGRTVLHFICNPSLLGSPRKLVDRGLLNLVLQGLSQSTCTQDNIPLQGDLQNMHPNMDIINWACTEGNTALHECCRLNEQSLDPSSSIECVQELLKHGADVTIKNKTGFTPFHLALKSESKSYDSLMPNILWSAMTVDQRAAEKEAIGPEVDLDSRFDNAT